MKRSEEILDFLQKEGQKIEIPHSLEPSQIEERLKAQEGKGKGKCHNLKKWKRYCKPLAAAACICLVAGGAAAAWRQGFLPGDTGQHVGENKGDGLSQEGAGNILPEGADDQESDLDTEGMPFPEMSYEEIYAAMSEIWESSARLEKQEMLAGTGIEDLMNSMDGVAVAERKMEASSMAEDAAAFGVTNVQVAGVDEGDSVKNDGRYLYQVIIEDEGRSRAIQILDTKDGLKELGRLGGFDEIEEFYVWQDLLIVIESKYQDYFWKIGRNHTATYEDMAWRGNGYHEISFYRITDREHPRKIKTFTLQGFYLSSRIADGYFYGFSRYYANPGNGEADYDAYVPSLDGRRLPQDCILFPEDGGGTSYLVTISIDLREPSSIFQSLGVISGGELYYVSEDNIYVTGYDSPYSRMEKKEGTETDRTSLLRFSYDKGKFYLRARGEIPGSVNDSFSLDEYEGYLRVVSTVQEFQRETVVDDRTNQVLGYDIRSKKQTNSLYILDENLDVTGKIEGLAEDEQIYSARFLGKTGYFVTFRQTDPLFAVDLSDPTAPSVLGELKVSGFSEYLHFYGKERLLGIGVEADEETGARQGMKLSMFDISEPSAIKEISRLNLGDYNYSRALYDHRAVLIDTGENIFGFEADGSDSGKYWRDYLLFSYEEDSFVRKLKLDTKNKDGDYYEARGTFIGDIFYLLLEDGTVRSYHRGTGALLESLEG